MKKITLTILGIISGLGIIQILWGIFNYIINRDADGLELSMYLLLPLIFSIFLFYKLLKNPEFFGKYATSINIFIYGIFIALILAISNSIILRILYPNEGFIDFGSLLIFVGVSIISFIAALIKWLITYFKK